MGERVELPGVVLPGLIDAHVHLTTTGLFNGELDFREARSVDALLAELKRFVEREPQREWVIGGNFDPGRNEEERMPLASDIDAICGPRKVLLARADGHSSALSSAGLDVVGVDDSVEGVDRGRDGTPTGVLRNEANYKARTRFFSALPDEEVRQAHSAACDVALSRGVTSVHEMAGGAIMGDRDFDLLVAAMPDLPINVKPYLATIEIDKVKEAGLDCIGGDLFLDGSIGSMTAAMTEPYEGTDLFGFRYHEDQEMIDWYVASMRAGLQTGVHAIGDAAIEQALRCLEAAARELGDTQVSRMRNRIEHFECVSDDHLERARKLGVVASVQPAFDAYWGGDGMYRQRLGQARSRRMNPFAAMVGEGMRPAGGSDSTVTPLDPFAGMAAAMGHHEPEHRVEAGTALRMFTIWAAEAGFDEENRGSIELGKVADFCVVSADPRALAADEVAGIQVLQTWVGGELAYSN
ncbi:MAG TPA: amidohydrolase [Actinomycetota bacterium]|nr:amidohydrolase [Actinomycetota bacterium]